MNEERWRQVDKIFQDVLDQEPLKRMAFLDRACGDDSSLKSEIEGLIRSFEDSGSFLDSPAADEGYKPDGRSTSLAGRVFGRYALRSLLGSGGMGEVYLARDAELKRDVAVKVLPDAFSRDADRVARFRREAEVLASLNHPNVATIYDLETLGESRCLILELVEGETLADLVARGPIPIDEALRLAKQIADALEAAHEKGIIHRDLKPANIKITRDGAVKVLDFGLAKIGEDESAAGGSALNSTGTMTTTPGLIMGTAAYMAPEQARGKVVDKRVDVWAFGCVLFEMLTGVAPFRRDTHSETLVAILEHDPEWTALPTTTPAMVRRLLSRCLEKDMRSRLHDIGDARIEIEDAIHEAALPAAKVKVVDRPTAAIARRWSVAAIAALFLIIAAGGLAWKSFTAPDAEVAPSTYTIAYSGAEEVFSDNPRSLAITPDGTAIIYVGTERALFVHPIGQLTPREIHKAAAPLNYVFSSHDGQRVGFAEGTRLKTMALNGGPVKTILEQNLGSQGATWLPDDTIILADADLATGLKRISSEGGDPKVLTWPDPGKGELDHIWPEMLPGGQAVLFTVTALKGGLDAAQVAVLDLATQNLKVFPSVRGSHAHYVAPGYLVYLAGGAMQALAFDPVLREPIGSSMPLTVPPNVKTTPKGGGHFDVAGNGTLAYIGGPWSRNMEEGRDLVIVDRKDTETPLGTQPGRYVYPRLSRDGNRVAVAIGGPEHHIAIWDRSQRKFSRLTFLPLAEKAPVWTLDESHLVFFVPGTGKGSLLWQLLAPNAEPSPLGGSGVPSGITRNGSLLFSPNNEDLSLMALDGTGKVMDLLSSPFIERNAVASSDDQLAFESDKLGGRFEVYVAAIANPSTKQRKISKSGGTRPVWCGNELFYVAPDDSLMAVRFGAGGEPLGDASIVVKGGTYVTGGNPAARNYDVFPDCKSFLMVKQQSDRGTLPRIVVVHSWSEILKRLLPVKR